MEGNTLFDWRKVELFLFGTGLFIMRQKKFAFNAITSFFLQVTTIICGFILPRMIMTSYGSNVNGLLNSIAQFLSVITFLEFGIGAVIQSALYAPLVRQDFLSVSKIWVSGNKFFRKIAYILLVYIVFLTICYPALFQQQFNWLYEATLILMISVSTFVQYYFGAMDGLLLSADQRGYIQYIIQIIIVLSNTIISVILIWCGASIHLVKGATSLIYLARPFFLRWYTNRYYALDRKICYTEEPVKNKLSGAMQHIAYMILNGTDIIVLTLCSTLENVSVYSVYNLVISGLKQVFTILDNSFHALIGELWARQDISKLNYIFGIMEWIFHTVAVFVFGCALVLMIPFVIVYTNGITDADYVQPLFSVLITLSCMINLLSYPYKILILVAGHFRETQWKFFISAILNMAISLFSVWKFGLVGVAAGTLIAMIYQDIWMIWYVSKHLNHWSLEKVLKQFFVDAVSFGIGLILSRSFELSEYTYIAWGVLAVKTALVWIAIVAGINLLFYRDKVIWILERGKEVVEKIRK